MFSANQTIKGARKDTVLNIERTGCFVWNVATWALREAVNITSEQVPPNVDEFARADLRKIPSTILKHEVPMVADSPIKFECEYFSTVRLPGNYPMGTVDVVIGKVVGIHIDESVLTDGMVDLTKVQPIARCGYYQYAVVKEVFEMTPPGGFSYGLEGNAEAVRGMTEKEKEEFQNGSVAK